MRKTKNETPIRTRPNANFTMVLGSLPRRSSPATPQAKTGASAMMNSGFSDWYQEAGKSKPNRVCRGVVSPNSDRVEPPWS